MKKPISIFKIILISSFLCVIISCASTRDLEPISGGEDVNLDAVYSDAELIPNLTSLVVYHNGNLVKEAFWGIGGEYNTQDIRSVTKSITGLLIGIAIDKGFIKSIDQPIIDFLIPSLDTLPSIFSSVKIRHLLTMSSGFYSDELSTVYTYNIWIESPNQFQYLLDSRLTYEPGRQFSYSSAAFHLLSIILSQATKMQTSDFAKKYLFEPLGIGERNWEKDNQGFNNGSAGLVLSPADMVKIGQLILNHGEYNGKRIVSSQWIDRSTVSQISTNNAQYFGPDYSYGWWIGEVKEGKYVFANGYGGQFIVVMPSLNLIVVATNYWYGIKSSMIKDQWNRTLTLIMTEIIPSFY